MNESKFAVHKHRLKIHHRAHQCPGQEAIFWKCIGCYQTFSRYLLFEVVVRRSA